MSFRTLLALLAISGQVYCFESQCEWVVISDEASEFRILSGRKASTLEFPYMAEIQRRNKHWCGGSIIHEYFVLSAAHCFYKGTQTEPVELYKVRVGNDERLKGGTVYDVKRFLVHENFDHLAAMDEYDIGLVQLVRPIQYTSRVQPVRLAEVTPEPGKKGWVIGFGKTSSTKLGMSEHLMAVELPVVDLNRCRKILQEVADDMICGGGERTLEDACQGDSGGPFVIENRQVGLVAWGIGCGQEGFPGAYTNVAHYKKWIESQIDKNSQPEFINEK